MPVEYEDLEDLPGIGKRRRISLLVFDNKVHPVQSTYSFSASKMYRFQRYFRLSVAVYCSLITVEFLASPDALEVIVLPDSLTKR